MNAIFRANCQVSIERRSVVRDPEYHNETEVWLPIATRIWADVQDVLPSRAERSAGGIRTGVTSARLRIRKRDVRMTDRVIVHRAGGKVMQIVAGPAQMDDRLNIEFMMEGSVP